MRDKDRSESRLNSEIERLRKRVAELENERTDSRNGVEDCELDVALSQTMDVLVVYNDTLEYTYINKNGASLLGLVPDDVVGKTNREIMGDGAQSIEPHVRSAFDKEEKVFALHRIPLSTGIRLFDTVYTPVVDGSGRVSRVVGICRDVTDDHMRMQRLEDLVNEQTQDLIRANEKLQSEVDERQLVEESLRNAHEELELRVKERTEDLLKSNRRLTDEVAERKQAETALRESQERFQTLAESTSDWIWEVDADAVYTYASPRVKDLLGYEPEEIVGITPFDLMPPDEVTRIKEDFTALKERRAPLERLENLNRHKDGHLVVLETSGVPFFDQQGNFRGYRGIDRDITARKRAEDALRESEERFRVAFHTSPDAISINRMDNANYTDVNEGFERLIGYSREEVIGKSAIRLNILHDQKVFDRFKEILRKDGEVSNLEVRFRLKDGTVRTGLLSATIMQVAEKSHVMTVIRDIEDWKRAEEKYRESERRFREFTDEVSFEGIIIHEQRKIVHVNRTFAGMYGYLPSELMGIDALLTIAPESREKVSQHIQEGYEKTYAAIGLRKNGSTFPIEIKTKSISFQGRIVRAAAVRDMTEHNLLEEQVRHATKMQAIGRLAGGVAHDFNNLLTVITGYSTMLLSDSGIEDHSRDEILEIKRAAEQAAGLTGQLLAFSRKQPAEKRVLDINETVSDLEKMLRILLGEDVELQLSLTPDIGRVSADQSQIQQIIINLAVNARDAMPKGGSLTIETAETFLDASHLQPTWDLEPGCYAMIAVSDTGHGMDSDTCSRIFEPFFTTKETGRGTGLGLSTVFGFVRQHMGHISVNSDLGRGTSFKVYLPLTAEEQERSKTRNESFLPHVDARETILVVEDEEMVRNVVCAVLSDLGHTILSAGSPAEALQICSQYRGTIDLLLSDIVMPGMDGPQLLIKIHSSRPHLRALFMSGYTERRISLQDFQKTGSAFVQKPFTPDILVNRVREVLDRPLD